MSTTLPLFWKLSSASKKERIDASVKLISALEQFQTRHVPQHKSDGSDNEGGDGLDAFNSQDVSYSIRRLVRGLASPRESSRLGFSVALTELLSRIETVTCAQVMTLIVDTTKRQGSMSGQEERDVLFARLFGIAAVIRSGLLVRQTPLPSTTSSSSNAPVSSLDTYEAVLKYLLELGEAKSWLRESAWWTIGLAVEAVQSCSVPWKAEALDATIRAVYSKDEESVWTMDKVAITLKLQSVMPDHEWDKTLAPVFKGRNIFAPNNLVSLGRILKEVAVDDEVTPNSGSGSWKAQLHVAWDVIFDRLLPLSGSEHVPQGSFSEFFRIVVDGSLFSPSSSPERKYWGFQVFKKALARVRATDIPMLFTKNLMRNWINHLSNKDRYLHRISLDVAKHIQTLVQASSSLGFPLILQLTGVNGSGQFDKLTRTKTVESILTVMDSAGIKNHVLSLLEQVNPPKDSEEEPSAIDSRRTWIADQFAALVRNGSIPKDDAWIQAVLDFYIVYGLFVVRKKSESNPIHALRTSPSPPFTEAAQQYCRERLLSCLGVLNAQLMVVKQDEHTHKEAGVASDGEFWISKTLATIASLDKDTKHVKPLLDMDEEVQASLSKTEKVIGQLRKTDDDKREVARGFELVLLSFLLQCRCGKADSLENLEPVLDATSNMFPSEKMPKKSKSHPTPLSEDDPSPIDVLVDVIVGFLEKASAFTRSVANESFSRVTGAVQGSTVDLILSQLERRDPSDLVEDDEGMTSGDDEDEDEDEEESSGEAGSGESDSEEGDDEAADEVRQKIKDALKASGVDVGDDDSEEDSDEELLDDEQMMALDDTLANIFRTRTNERKSKQGIDAQRKATHFKNRVLDLVDIFVKLEPQSPLNVRLVIPLVELATKSSIDERQLSDKASGILKSRLVKSKEVPTTAVRDEVEPVLQEVHRRAQRAHASDALGVLSQGSLYLCRILVSLNEDDAAITAYRESWDDYMSRKASQLAFSFFQEWARRFPGLGRKLRDHVLESSSKAVNVYRKCQAFQLLHVMMGQPDKGENPATIVTFHRALQKSILDLIVFSVDDDRGLSPTQVKDLLKLVLSCIRQTHKTAESSTPQVWDPAAWKALHDQLSSSDRFKSSTSVLNMCHQVETIAAQCKQGVVIKGKRKAESEEVTETDALKKSNRKKQKKSKP
ncbi:DNA polymerase phi-domain-containing protein [Boletus edulis BED1]|uniref:DNA polymerase phi-domain-containing protein n=1 Tax=Boletus edulis BED1 TaxID=1328754 RepID=A0AAD4GJC4_BOLED|nr:DNA polymerase phi-domain-containing protein [Boletus edulis BED1]